MDRRLPRVAGAAAGAAVVVSMAAGLAVATGAARSAASAFTQVPVAGGRGWILYAQDNSNSATLRIDTATGAASRLGDSGFRVTASGLAAARGPVTAPDGTVFEAGTVFGLLTDGASRRDFVAAIDLDTGAATKVVASSRLFAGRGVAFGPDGSTLYVLEATANLFTIDVASGVARRVGPVTDMLGVSYSGVSLQWDPVSGEFIALVGAPNDTLVRINPRTARAVRLARIPGLSSCTLSRLPGPAPAPGGGLFPGGTWFTVNQASSMLVTLSFDSMRPGAATLEAIGPLGPAASAAVCGSAFVLAAPPSPTATSSATTTPTAVAPTATSTATATPSPGPIYLPVVLGGQCRGGAVHTDVVLVFDASTSMLQIDTSGRRKIDMAREAVGRFLALLAPEDQAGLVGFNASARVTQHLTTDRGRMAAALAAVEVARTTRLDVGVAVAHGELIGPYQRPDHTRAMVVLTDGRANPVPVAAAVAAAAAARADAIRVFTIGVGDQVEEEALRAMATGPGDFFSAPDASALADIYRRVAFSLPCRTNGWGGR